MAWKLTALSVRPESWSTAFNSCVCMISQVCIIDAASDNFIEHLTALNQTRYTMERPRFTDHLEAIKFICKDFWSELFKKQIDNLKTNHRVITRCSNHSYIKNFILGLIWSHVLLYGRVPLSCKIIGFGGSHAYRLSPLQKAQMHLPMTLHLRPRTRLPKPQTCISVSHVEL